MTVSMRRVVAALCGAWCALWTLQAAAAPSSVVLSLIEGDSMSQSAFQIMTEAYRRLGIDAKAEILPNERALEDSNDGVTDAETMRKAGIEARYSNLVMVPEPVLSFDTVVFTTGLSFTVNGWDSLRPYSVCLLKGMKLAEDGTLGMQRMMGTTPEQVVRMLAAGRCDAAVLGTGIWTEIDRLKVGPMRALEPPVSVVPLFHYVNRRHAGLVSKLAEILRQMRGDGTIDRLLAGDAEVIKAARQRNSLPDR